MPFKIPHLRWWIAGMLFLASILNYVDRQALSILAPTIQAELHITDEQYANVASFFLAAYATAYLLSGPVTDALGSRLSMALFVGWWSVANAMTGLAQGFASLAGVRFLLGLGEAGNYTVAPKVVSEWFPQRDRGLAVGIYSMGGAVGATLAPILVVALAERYTWRGPFFVTGLLGLIFVALWWVLFQSPRRHPWLTEAERALILAEPATPETLPVQEPLGVRWRAIATSRLTWGLMAARLLSDPLWYFCLTWLTKYLSLERGLSQKELAGTWVIFLAADAGFLGAGFLSGWLIARGLPAPRSRLMVMFGAAALVPLFALVPGAGNMTTVYALTMAVALAHASWLSSLTAYVVDVIPRAVLGTSFGFIAAGSAFGGIAMNQLVGWAIGKYHYAPCFYVLAGLHPVALTIIWLTRPRVREVEL